ncbi:hypothetical protein BAUCODRAFT_143968 [Baudoinia panamericana UAMH 10762]|uniref:Ubiquitin-like protease family profile domain-containing protein n=1 Tax=Baudoinia panamericana (strain UAMH 10762) TaxID=717646 RepID=M2LB03_BAUPA|nr:uncharacterized protein BAUCODRAFT_143968 [Baudoinia panamericana UAMH 10762]EMC90987.1 hypothetical protein BAUCODRAFT_143968 [Baudoinia panamericana UAMH 10762]
MANDGDVLDDSLRKLNTAYDIQSVLITLNLACEQSEARHQDVSGYLHLLTPATLESIDGLLIEYCKNHMGRNVSASVSRLHRTGWLRPHEIVARFGTNAFRSERFLASLKKLSQVATFDTVYPIMRAARNERATDGDSVARWTAKDADTTIGRLSAQLSGLDRGLRAKSTKPKSMSAAPLSASNGGLTTGGKVTTVGPAASLPQSPWPSAHAHTTPVRARTVTPSEPDDQVHLETSDRSIEQGRGVEEPGNDHQFDFHDESGMFAPAEYSDDGSYDEPDMELESHCGILDNASFEQIGAVLPSPVESSKALLDRPSIVPDTRPNDLGNTGARKRRASSDDILRLQPKRSRTDDEPTAVPRPVTSVGTSRDRSAPVARAGDDGVDKDTGSAPEPRKDSVTDVVAPKAPATQARPDGALITATSKRAVDGNDVEVTSWLNATNAVGCLDAIAPEHRTHSVTNVVASETSATQSRPNEALDDAAPQPGGGGDDVVVTSWLTMQDVRDAVDRLHAKDFDGYFNNALIDVTLRFLNPNPQLWHIVEPGAYTFELLDRHQTGKYRGVQESHRYIVLPVYFAKALHWVMAVLDLELEEYDVYEPTQDAETYAKAERVVDAFIGCMCRYITGTDHADITTPIKSWKKLRRNTLLQQRDAYNCGLYGVINTLYLMYTAEPCTMLEPAAWRELLAAGFRPLLTEHHASNPVDQPTAAQSVQIENDHDFANVQSTLATQIRQVRNQRHFWQSASQMLAHHAGNEIARITSDLEKHARAFEALQDCHRRFCGVSEEVANDLVKLQAKAGPNLQRHQDVAAAYRFKTGLRVHLQRVEQQLQKTLERLSQTKSALLKYSRKREEQWHLSCEQVLDVVVPT